MAANVYECMFLLDTTKAGGDLATIDKTIRTILERNKAEVLVSRPWDERRLTYPIKNQKKGLYYLTYFTAPGPALVGIEQDCKLNESILRQMIIKIHPKLVETMLSLAKGEHAVALHNIHDEPSEEAAAGGEPVGVGDGEGGPRRRRPEPRD